MNNVEIIFEPNVFFQNIKDSIINFFPEDIFIKLTIIAMALTVGYGIDRLYEINKK